MGRSSFTGGLVRKSELMQNEGKNGRKNKFLFFTLARNYSRFDEETKSWVEEGSVFQECVVFGTDAEAFSLSDTPLGTEIFVEGTLRGKTKQAWVDNSGVEHPEEFVEEITVDMIGVPFKKSQVVTGVSRIREVQGGGGVDQTQYKPKQPEKKAEKAAVEQGIEDIFSDSSDSQVEDLFDFS